MTHLLQNVTILYPMKRGLKVGFRSARSAVRTRVTILYPMKRGLKVTRRTNTLSSFSSYNPLPDEKGTESLRPDLDTRQKEFVTILYPMKRGLKDVSLMRRVKQWRLLQSFTR